MEVSDIVSAVDIVEYIGQYVDLEQRGQEFWGLSPFKDEKTPSFSIHPDKQCFYDFSSGNCGDIVDFIKLYHGCGFNQAVELLQNYAGIEGKVAPRIRLESTKIAKKYRPPARQKQSAPLSPMPDDYMSTFEWAPDKFQSWLNEGISTETLLKYDVRYDPLSNRIVYPIRRTDGKIVNVCGRTLDDDYKAKKIAKYIYLQKWGGTPEVVFGLFEHSEAIRQRKEFIIFEGVKSCMQASEWGVDNTGALLTSHLSYCQFKLLLPLGATVVFALDSDVDITQDENIRRLKNYVKVEYLCDTEGLLDPKDSPTDKGSETFFRLYSERRRL